MRIVAPTWRLANRRCPCACEGEGALAFQACPACGALVLVCDELGTVFADPHAISRDAADTSRNDPFDVCPTCKQVTTADFRPATDEIRALGFGPDEYCCVCGVELTR